MSGKKTDYFSKTIEKGFSIINLFDQNHTRRNLTEISRLLGINTTSTYRYVNTLIELGYLKRVSNSKMIKLGPKALSLGYQFLQGFELLQSIKPLIDKTFQEQNITIDTVLKDGDTLIALYRREAKNTINFRHPLVSKSIYARATGKAILANLPREELSTFLFKTELISKTENTIVESGRLLADLELTQKRGYSLANEEYLPGLNAIGAPLINIRNHEVLGAVSFDFPSLQFSIEEIEKNYADAIRQIALDLSEVITAADD
jgi:IclR family pca regulon transcriptional regulator